MGLEFWLCNSCRKTGLFFIWRV